jgi:hypothetical protein
MRQSLRVLLHWSRSCIHAKTLIECDAILWIQLIKVISLFILIIRGVVLTVHDKKLVECLLPVLTRLHEHADEVLMREFRPKGAEVTKDIGVNVCEVNRLFTKHAEFRLHGV